MSEYCCHGPLYARFGAIAPRHRGAKLAARVMEFGENLARAMRAGFIYQVLVPDEDLLHPDPKNLSPKAKALFYVIFPHSNA